MSKLMKIVGGVALAASLALAAPGVAEAQHWHGHGGWHGGWHGGYHGGWHRGGWGWGPGFALGFGLGAAAPYYYGPGYYYGPPARCGWVRLRYWRYGRWHWRRAWRCW